MAQQADDRAAEAPPPAPRGSSPTPPQRPRFRLSPRWIVFFLALLALNIFISSRAMEPESRVRVPYSPFFLQQVKAGNVEEITSKGTDIQGTFKKERDATRTRSRRRDSGRRSRRSPTPTSSRSCSRRTTSRSTPSRSTRARRGGRRCCSASGRRSCFVLLLFWLFRRAGNVQNALGSFGRSRARRYEPSGDKVTFADVAGIDEAKEELSEVVDFLRNPDKYRRLGGRIPHGVLLSGPPGTGQDAARARGRRRGGRAVLLDGGLRVRRGDRRGRRRARARPLQGGEGERAGDRVHRRARRDRPLAHERRRRLQRRQRRARADAEPDPDRDGRVRLGDERDRHRRDEPARRARPGAASAGAVRPPGRRPAAGPGRARGDPSGAHARRPARPRRRPRAHRRDDAGNGRRRPRQPRQRGGAHRRPARATTWSRKPTSPTRSSGSCSAPSAR